MNLEALSGRVKQLESAISDSFKNVIASQENHTNVQANHHQLLGALAEVKIWLNFVSKVAQEVAPGNPVSAIIDIVDNVEEMIENKLTGESK